jgi:hypothetical protein
MERSKTPRRDLLKACMARSRHTDETHFGHNRPSPSSFDSANLVIQMQLGQPNVILFDEPTVSLGPRVRGSSGQ